MNIQEQTFINKKIKMLNWANQFNIFCLLDNNGYDFEAPAFECILAVGCESSFSFTGINDFENLQTFFDKNPTWLFGHLGYNAAGNAYQKNNDLQQGFGTGFFFEPQILLKYSNGKIEVLKTNIDKNKLLEDIDSIESENIITSNTTILHSLTKEKYIEKIKNLQSHIKRGDCYEINFCKQFFANDVTINPIETYIKLTKISPAPFAALYKLNNQYCICASPERFLQKKGMQLISQPIKGTSSRDEDNKIDNLNKIQLQESNKEKSENVMVVDLVRNDMSVVCEKASVKVKELFGIYSFPQVHQMISTIVGTLSPSIPFTQAIAACFPMGSMTGAPKQRVMELIELFEEQDRDLFSGSIGYINPQANFDFNVVIRSIFYNQNEEKIKLFAGSGITFYSDPEAEYNECLSKVAAMIGVLNN